MPADVGSGRGRESVLTTGREETTVKKFLGAVCAVVVTAACASQQAPARMALEGLDTAVAAAKPDIEKFAADQMAGITDAVGAAKQKFEGGDYAGVIADVQTVTARVSEAAKAAAEKKAALTAEWASFATLPAMVGQVTAKLTELGAMRRLPAGLDTAKVDGAKASLEMVNGLWTEASAAFEQGDLVAAVAKAKDVKPMVDALMNTLGMAAAAAR